MSIQDNTKKSEDNFIKEIKETPLRNPSDEIKVLEEDGLIKVATIKGIDVFYDVGVQMNFIGKTPFRSFEEAKNFILKNH